MNREELKSYLEERGEKVVDLGIGYDHSQINQEIQSGYYSGYITIAHGNSGIDADCFYGDSQEDTLRFPVIVEGTDEMGRNIELTISSKQTLIDLINQWEHPQNVMLTINQIS